MGLAEVLVSISQPLGERFVLSLSKTRLQKQV